MVVDSSGLWWQKRRVLSYDKAHMLYKTGMYKTLDYMEIYGYDWIRYFSSKWRPIAGCQVGVI